MQELPVNFPKTRDTILQVRVSFFYAVDRKLYRHEKTYLAKENSSYGVSVDTDSIDGYPIWFIMRSIRYRSIEGHGEYERLSQFSIRDWIAHKECMQGNMGIDLSTIRIRFRDLNQEVYRVKVTGESIFLVEYEKQNGEATFVPFEGDIVDPTLQRDTIKNTSGGKIKKPEFEEHEIAVIVEDDSEYPILLDEEILRSIRSVLRQ